MTQSSFSDSQQKPLKIPQLYERFGETSEESAKISFMDESKKPVSLCDLPVLLVLPTKKKKHTKELF